jgi:hypothetical protein
MRLLERFAITRGSRRSPRHVDVRIAVLYGVHAEIGGACVLLQDLVPWYNVICVFFNHSVKNMPF